MPVPRSSGRAVWWYSVSRVSTTVLLSALTVERRLDGGTRTGTEVSDSISLVPINYSIARFGAGKIGYSTQPPSQEAPPSPMLRPMRWLLLVPVHVLAERMTGLHIAGMEICILRCMCR